MIRRSTWILLLLLAILVGAAFYLKDRSAKLAAATPTAGSGSGSQSKPLFGVEEGQVTSVAVSDQTGNSVEVKRNLTGEWVLQAPTQTKANQASAEAAATQVTSLRVISSVQLGLDVVGLDKPAYTVTIGFSTGKTYTLKVGAETPIQDGYYTSLDGGSIQVVDKQGLDALTGLLTNPPYEATLTPVATATVEAPAVPAGTSLPTTETAPAVTPTP